MPLFRSPGFFTITIVTVTNGQRTRFTPIIEIREFARNLLARVMTEIHDNTLARARALGSTARE